jgi:type VI secretion system protein ImpB
MGSSQKFIARNRAPRVQIEYDVELYGAQKKVQLPFVMGVMADLSGKPEEQLPPVADRKFLEVDVDNFDARMKAMKPRSRSRSRTRSPARQPSGRHHVREHGRLSPAAVARKVDGLNKLRDRGRARPFGPCGARRRAGAAGALAGHVRSGRSAAELADRGSQAARVIDPGP